MMPWCHCWACSSPLIAYHIHIEHTYCVFLLFNQVHRHISLSGNVDIFDIFKRLILKTCLRVVPTCQPNIADMPPTLQLLMFFSHHMPCRVVDCQHVDDATTSQCRIGTTREVAVQWERCQQRQCNKEWQDKGIGWWRRQLARVPVVTDAGVQQI